MHRWPGCQRLFAPGGSNWQVQTGYSAGGFSRTDGHFQPARTVEVYDPEADTWQVAHEALPFAERAGTMMEFQDRLLFYGIDREQDGIATKEELEAALSAGDGSTAGRERN